VRTIQEKRNVWTVTVFNPQAFASLSYADAPAQYKLCRAASTPSAQAHLSCVFESARTHPVRMRTVVCHGAQAHQARKRTNIIWYVLHAFEHTDNCLQ